MTIQTRVVVDSGSGAGGASAAGVEQGQAAGARVAQAGAVENDSVIYAMGMNLIGLGQFKQARLVFDGIAQKLDHKDRYAAMTQIVYCVMMLKGPQAALEYASDLVLGVQYLNEDEEASPVDCKQYCVPESDLAFDVLSMYLGQLYYECGNYGHAMTWSMCAKKRLEARYRGDIPEGDKALYERASAIYKLAEKAYLEQLEAIAAVVNAH